MISILAILSVLAQAGQVDGHVSIEQDGLSQKSIQQSYEQLTPAICMLTYTLEITNNNGEVSRRTNNAIGLIVSEDGLVMAHGHLVLENRKPFNIRVTVGEGDEKEEYEATLLSKPDDINVTFLKLKTDEDVDFPYVEFEESNELSIGSPVFSIGLLSSNLDHTKAVQTRRVGAMLSEPRTTFCLDEAVTFGYIGGPVMDAQGRPIGVIGFDLSTGEGGDLYTRSGYPLIFQSSLFQPYIDTPPGGEEEDEDEDAWLGIFTQPLSDDLAEYWGIAKEGGVVVSTVIPGSPAQKVGLQSGDVVVNFNGTAVKAKEDQDIRGFTLMVRESPVGVELPVTYLRDGKQDELALTLTTRPKSSADADEHTDELFGLTVREITTDMRIRLNLAEGVEGVLVRKVTPGGLANRATIRPGFVILRIGDALVTDLDSFKQIVETVKKDKPSEVAVLCRVGANTAFFRIQPRWNAE